MIELLKLPCHHYIYCQKRVTKHRKTDYRSIIKDPSLPRTSGRGGFSAPFGWIYRFTLFTYFKI